MPTDAGGGDRRRARANRGQEVSIRLARLPLLAAALTLIAAPAPRAVAEDAAWLREEVFRRIDRGVAALRAGDPLAAEEDACWAYRRALNNHAAAWYCGRAALGARHFDLAIEALELAVELQPKHLGSGLDLGRAYLAAGDVNRARAAFFRLLGIRRDYSPAYVGLAQLAERTGDDERALELYAQAIEANPADAFARLRRGELHLRRGRIDDALADIREAARLRPDDAEIEIGLAQVLLRAGLLDEALGAARAALAISPASPVAHAVLAAVFARKGALVEAEEEARRALERHPVDPAPRLVLAEVLGRTGRLDEALAVLEHPDESVLTPDERAALERERARWSARRRQIAELTARVEAGEAGAAELLVLAEAELETGRAGRAVELARRAVEAGLPEPDLARRAARVLGRAGRLLEAERVLAPLVDAGVAGPVDLANLGVIRERTGDPDGAAEAYRQALAASPPRRVAIAARAGLARLAIDRGDADTAREQLEALLALGPPTDVAARARLALERLGRPVAAAPAEGEAP
ncbi:MAG: tetratricopeptide repeat protein [Acidobacteria bacterium]|nr:MAG: tetratricopeptide repeat protein [Acidobacteriota bacterium]